MSFIIGALVFVLLFTLITFIRYLFLNRYYQYFDIVQQREAIDPVLGYISWGEKSHYRRHRLTCLWQKKVYRLYVEGKKGRLKKKSFWEDISMMRTKTLEKLFQEKT